jgi:hypothetical protein
LVDRVYRVRSKSERGIAILEAALLVPIFVVIVFFIVDVGGVVWQTVGLQYALTDTARWIVPDRRHPKFPGRTYTTDITNSIRQYAEDRARSLGVRLSSCDVTVCDFSGAYCECPVPITGCPNSCTVVANAIPAYDYPEGFRISGTVQTQVILGFLKFPITRHVFTKIEAQ